MWCGIIDDVHINSDIKLDFLLKHLYYYFFTDMNIFIYSENI